MPRLTQQMISIECGSGYTSIPVDVSVQPSTGVFTLSLCMDVQRYEDRRAPVERLHKYGSAFKDLKETGNLSMQALEHEMIRRANELLVDKVTKDIVLQIQGMCQGDAGRASFVIAHRQVYDNGRKIYSGVTFEGETVDLEKGIVPVRVQALMSYGSNAHNNWYPEHYALLIPWDEEVCIRVAAIIKTYRAHCDTLRQDMASLIDGLQAKKLERD